MTASASWVAEITTQFNQEPYRDVTLSGPSYSPQAALEAGNRPLAQSYVDWTTGLFDTGAQ